MTEKIFTRPAFDAACARCGARWFNLPTRELASQILEEHKKDCRPTTVTAILNEIHNGTYDADIEDLLEAAHHRKRMIRGVRPHQRGC